jgi:hypothetical protein
VRNLADRASRRRVRIIVMPQAAGSQETNERRECCDKQHALANSADGTARSAVLQRIVTVRHRVR